MLSQQEQLVYCPHQRSPEGIHCHPRQEKILESLCSGTLEYRWRHFSPTGTLEYHWFSKSSCTSTVEYVEFIQCHAHFRILHRWTNLIQRSISLFPEPPVMLHFPFRIRFSVPFERESTGALELGMTFSTTKCDLVVLDEILDLRTSRNMHVLRRKLMTSLVLAL